MSQDSPDVIFEETGKQAETMSNDEMESFFDEAKAEEVGHTDDTQSTNQEATSHEKPEQHERTEESTESEQLPVESAELSDEDGREERTDKQLPADEGRTNERHQQSYKVALKEERVLRQQIQKDLAEQREASKKLSDAFSKLVEGADSSKEPPAPSFDDDPIGHMKAKLEAADKRIEGLTETETKMQQEQQNTQNMREFMSAYRSKADSFARDQPDFGDAYKHLVNEIKQDYMAQGLTEDQAAQQANNDELKLADQQMRNQINPAKTIYDMAVRRGYRTAANPANEANESKKTAALDKLNRMERGMKASRSINGMGVTPRTSLPTPEEIDQMTDKEFDAFDWDSYVSHG